MYLTVFYYHKAIKVFPFTASLQSEVQTNHLQSSPPTLRIYLNSSGPPQTVNMICSGWKPSPEYATVCQPVHIPQKHFRAVFIECKTQPLVRNMILLGSTCGEAGKRLFLLLLNAGVL